MEKGSDGKDQRKRERWEGGVIIKGMEKGREREGGIDGREWR